MQAQAIRIHEFGGPDVQRLENIEVGKPGAGQALLRQTAAGVNFLDIYHRRGEAQPTGGLPFINGFEGAGVVEKVGVGVDANILGTRVAYTLAIGAYATYRLVPAARLITLPDTISDETAAAIMLKGTTAEYLVNRLYAVAPGHVVLVHAAAGGVGSLICQWSKHLGAVVIGTVSSERKAEAAKINGCDHVIVMADAGFDFRDAVKTAVGDNAVSVVYDGIAGPTLLKSLDLLRPKGHAIVLGNAGGKAAPIDVHALKAKSLTITSPSLPHFTGERGEYQKSVRVLFQAYERGILRVPNIDRYALSEATAAHVAIESRAAIGSTILVMQ